MWKTYFEINLNNFLYTLFRTILFVKKSWYTKVYFIHRKLQRTWLFVQLVKHYLHLPPLFFLRAYLLHYLLTWVIKSVNLVVWLYKIHDQNDVHYFFRFRCIIVWAWCWCILNSRCKFLYFVLFSGIFVLNSSDCMKLQMNWIEMNCVSTLQVT